MFIGNKCPIEIMLVDEWREQYLDLMKQNEIDYDNIVVHNYINELIECDNQYENESYCIAW